MHHRHDGNVGVWRVFFFMPSTLRRDRPGHDRGCPLLRSDRPGGRATYPPPTPPASTRSKTRATATATSRIFCREVRRAHHPPPPGKDGSGSASGGYHFPSEASHQSSSWGRSLIPSERTHRPECLDARIPLPQREDPNSSPSGEVAEGVARSRRGSKRERCSAPAATPSASLRSAPPPDGEECSAPLPQGEESSASD